MSLSGTVTTSVMWLVAAATFIWAVLSLAKATGTPGRVDLRTTYLRGAGTQLAVVATALLAVAGTLNAQYDWYSSWSDLGTAFQVATPQLAVPSSYVQAQVPRPHRSGPCANRRSGGLTQTPARMVSM